MIDYDYDNGNDYDTDSDNEEGRRRKPTMNRADSALSEKNDPAKSPDIPCIPQPPVLSSFARPKAVSSPLFWDIGASRLPKETMTMDTCHKLRIAGIGEVLWDCFPEHEAFGGAPANFSCHCGSLGAEAYVISAIGNDERGAKAKAFLAGHKVNTAALAETTYETGVVNVVLDEKGKPEYEIKEGVAWDHIPWHRELADLAGRLDAICFGSLGQRSPASRNTIRRVLAATGPACLRVFDINLRQAFYSHEIILSSLELANVLKLNDEELPVVAGLIGARGDNKSLMAAIIDRFALTLAVLTLGPEGALMMTPDDSSFVVPPDDPVINTVGAGDSFTAAMITGFLKGGDLEKINRHANLVATFVCTQDGAVPELPVSLTRNIWHE